MERMKGFEPSTFCMASRRSSQLSYIRPVPRGCWIIDQALPSCKRGRLFPTARLGRRRLVQGLIDQGVGPGVLPPADMPERYVFESGHETFRLFVQRP